MGGGTLSVKAAQSRLHDPLEKLTWVWAARWGGLGSGARATARTQRPPTTPRTSFLAPTATPPPRAHSHSQPPPTPLLPPLRSRVTAMGSACTKSDAVADGKGTQHRKEMTGVQPQAVSFKLRRTPRECPDASDASPLLTSTLSVCLRVDQGSSPTGGSGGGVILVGARSPPPPLESAAPSSSASAAIASPTSRAGSSTATEAAEASTHQSHPTPQQPQPQQTGSNEARGPAPVQLLSTPNLAGKKLSARRASGSQMLADSASLLNAHAAPAASATATPAAVRRISRPSTPMSRSVSEQARMGAGLSLGSPASPPLVDPLGWGVAPNSAAAFDLAGTTPAAPTSAFTLGGVSSARAARRRTEQPGVPGIPETIAERLNREPTAAVNALPVPAAVAHSNRRATGTERIRGFPALGSKGGPGPDGSATATATPSRDRDSSHRTGEREGGHGFGGRAKEEESRYELTDAQERELREKPFLWTEPQIWKHHPQACFTYYATLPLPASNSPTAASAAAAAAAASSNALPAVSPKSSLSSLPSIHHADRIVWPQLQCLARDCIQRLYLLVRKDVKRSLESARETLEESQLEKRIWNQLETLLPGHGSESKTHSYVSLFLLSSLAKTVPGSVGRREFLVLWPEAHQALFAWPPQEVNMKDRRKLIQRIYGLKLEEMLKPFPMASGTSANGGGDHAQHSHHTHHSPSPDPPSSSSSAGGASDTYVRSPAHALSAPSERGDRSRRHSLNKDHAQDQAHQLSLALSAAMDHNARANAERRGGNNLMPVSSNTSSRRGSYNATNGVGTPLTLGENLLLSSAAASLAAGSAALAVSRHGSATNSRRNSRPLTEEEQALVDERREMRRSRRASKQASRSRSRSHKRSHSRSPAAKEAE